MTISRLSVCLSVCIGFFVLGPADANAQMPQPAVHLATLPNPISHGDEYTIAGTVTDIADGQVIRVEIDNFYPNPNGNPPMLTKSASESCSVSGGAFTMTDSFTFLGSGSFFVYGTLVSDPFISDAESGDVSAP